MPPDTRPHLLHMIVPQPGATTRYISTRSGRPAEFQTPPRNRAGHAATLTTQLHAAVASGTNGFPKQIGNGFYLKDALTLTFESEADFPLKFESLEFQRSGIELLSVTTDAQNRTHATVRVPEDKVRLLVNKIEDYRTKQASPNNPEPKNKDLVEGITSIRHAVLRELWTDPQELYPAPGTVFTWEVWLKKQSSTETTSPEARLRAEAPNFGYQVVSRALQFVDRSVVLVRGTPEQLTHGLDVLAVIAEVRKAKVAADYFIGKDAVNQNIDITGLVNRTSAPTGTFPYITLLDSGVNHGHPLLAPIINMADLHTYNPAWGLHDAKRHGTSMASLALFGDLTTALSHQNQVQITHGIESVKMFNPAAQHAPDSYGVVTEESIARVEVNPNRSRIYCMTITSEDTRDRGRPTSWSGAVDQLAFGDGINRRRLIVLSGGNADEGHASAYPASNYTDSIHDPSQSWNALTVGGYTEKVITDEQAHPGWSALAPAGDLAPCNTTSMTWPRSPKWPYKPDIVMEAGNMGVNPLVNPSHDFLDHLSLLAANANFGLGHRPLTATGDTSAAAALASKMAASLWAQYPSYTPETLRGMLVHSARWTPAMLIRATGPDGMVDTNELLRTVGHGTPDERALHWSASNSLTLIAQDRLQPFYQATNDDGQKSIKTLDLKLHALPWPTEVLQDLQNTEVTMKVTLSYFIEPSPGERGWDKKYGYPSHGLRFHVQRPTETALEFQQRINRAAQDEDFDGDDVADDTGRWTFGARCPSTGSIHSNTWVGRAAELANRSHIAVCPTLGWWKTRQSEGRYTKQVAYSLIVTISTPSVEMDIYTPVANIVTNTITTPAITTEIEI